MGTAHDGKNFVWKNSPFLKIARVYVYVCVCMHVTYSLRISYICTVLRFFFNQIKAFSLLLDLR